MYTKTDIKPMRGGGGRNNAGTKKTAKHILRERSIYTTVKQEHKTIRKEHRGTTADHKKRQKSQGLEGPSKNSSFIRHSNRIN